MKALVAFFLLCYGSVASLNARDLASLYDTGTLQYWQTRYRTSTNKILQQVVLPALKSAELRRLSGVPLDMPLYAEGEWRSQLLAFYVPGDLSRVVFPILSLKFLDDLCTAYAWLQINGYSLDTISEYAAMLKYKDFPTGRYPQPLKALRIPDNALQDPRVNELALGHFVTARTFLLLHELGHISSARSARTLEESQRNEEEADAFASEVMSRTPLPPLGVIVFFMADMSWADYPPKPGTHPLSGRRMRALAGRLQDRQLAALLVKFGELVDDPETRAGVILTAKSTDESTLAPRKGHLQLRQSLVAAPAGGSLPFNGLYAGESTQALGATQRFPIEMILHRNGNEVTGQYSFGLGTGLIRGTVSGTVLTLTWVWAGKEGRAVLTASHDGTGFSGTWGFGQSTTGAGMWNGRLKR